MEDPVTELVRETNNHPFKDGRVVAVIDNNCPEYAQLIKDAVLPGVSITPDEMERWEAGEIERRKQRLANETDFGYALRVLYEETFSVNQFPDQSFKGSNGLTLGGLISHFHPWSIMDGVGLEDAADWDLKGKQLNELLANESNMKKREQIFDLAERITYPGNGLNSYLRMPGQFKHKFLINPVAGKYKEDLDTYGTRLIMLVNTVPELTEEVEDKGLRELCGIKENRKNKFTKLEAVVHLWRRLSRQIINENGTYRSDTDEMVRQGFKDMVFIRTHPEMQFLYKYMSASGYLNKSQPLFVDENSKAE